MDDADNTGRVEDPTEPRAGPVNQGTPPQSPRDRVEAVAGSKQRVFEGVVVSPTAIAVASLTVAVVGYMVSRYDRLVCTVRNT